MATLIAQYPDVQEVVGADRKDRIPCILPQVVFINWRIFVASVVERGEAKESWLIAAALLNLLRGTVWLEYFWIEGKPIEDEGSSGTFG